METLTRRVESEGARVEPEATVLLPAGVFRRAVALLVDLALVGLLLETGELARAPLAPWPHIARALGLAYLLVGPAAYFVLMHGTGGQTVGKRLVGAQVVTASGEALGYLRALARQVAWFVAAVLLLGSGHLLAVVRPDRRALHDLVAGTRVVRAR